MIVMVGHEKGGVGKSTIAITLAHLIAQVTKAKVALVDTDESNNTCMWGQLRSSLGLTSDVTIMNQAIDPTANIPNLAKVYDVVVVDVGAGDYKRLIEMARIVDLWIAPTGPSQKEADSNINLIEAFASANHKHKNGKIPLAFVYNRAPASSNSTEAQEAIEALRQYAPEVAVMNSVLCERKIYRDADKMGRTIMEMAPAQRRKAEAEFVAFFNEAFSIYDQFQKEAKNGKK